MPREVHPPNADAFLFSYFLASLRRLGALAPKPLRSVGAGVSRLLSRFFFTISPAVPIDLRKSLADDSLRRVMLSSFACGLLFSLVGTGLFSWLDGTLIGPAEGADPHRRYFVEDGWNLALYTFVTPTYVALATGLIVLTIKHWAALSDFSNEVAVDAVPSGPRRLGVALVIALAMCAVFITNYMHDILNQAHVADVYWFMEEVGGARRTLNRAGYYYVALNFGLLFVTLLGIAAFFSLTVEIFRIGDSLQTGRVRDFSVLRSRLATFTTAYLMAKLLAATYMVNAFIWKDSPLGQTANLTAAGLALTVVGVFFIAIPRLFVELKWFQYAIHARQNASGVDDVDELYKDIRPRHVRLWAHVLDVMLIGGFMTAFWELDFSPAAILKMLRP